eukprot:3193167-Amphidinium_carterae.1
MHWEAVQPALSALGEHFRTQDGCNARRKNTHPRAWIWWRPHRTAQMKKTTCGLPTFLNRSILRFVQ